MKQLAEVEGDPASQGLKVNQLFEVEDEPPSQGLKVNHQAKVNLPSGCVVMLVEMKTLPCDSSPVVTVFHHKSTSRFHWWINNSFNLSKKSRITDDF